MSSLYSSFGLDDSRLKEASKLVIGSNNSFNYDIEESTHVDTDENIEIGNYPIGYYALTEDQGQVFPNVIIVGGDMTIATSN
ncbi:MAG: hypothetical protein MJ233_05115 [Mycoplasmoidaceae bacterium]|nr:hypothetical protein [Mycoplasmoidaceae bacterium]